MCTSVFECVCGVICNRIMHAAIFPIILCLVEMLAEVVRDVVPGRVSLAAVSTCVIILILSVTGMLFYVRYWLYLNLFSRSNNRLTIG